jgi:hypothetical protein
MLSAGFFKRRSNNYLAALVCVVVAGGAATLAQADWRNSALMRVELELRNQSKLLGELSESWAAEAKSRADFTLYKLQAAQIAASPAAEFTHMDHACQALLDERTILLSAQDEDAQKNTLVDQLIEQTFEHREALGCRE